MPEIVCLAVIGAGHIGWRIAALAALAGYRTILEDVLPASLHRAENGIRGHLARLSSLGNISRLEAEAALAHLEYSDNLAETARQADLVIEAVPDEMESKLEIFALLDRIARPHTILASTTSALTVGEIAATTHRANRILGLRFPAAVEDPEARSGRLDIVLSAETDDETAVACIQVGRRMVNNVVVVAEGSGN